MKKLICFVCVVVTSLIVSTANGQLDIKVKRVDDWLCAVDGFAKAQILELIDLADLGSYHPTHAQDLGIAYLNWHEARVEAGYNMRSTASPPNQWVDKGENYCFGGGVINCNPWFYGQAASGKCDGLLISESKYESKHLTLQATDKFATIWQIVNLDFGTDNWDAIPIGTEVAKILTPKFQLVVVHIGNGEFKILGRKETQREGEEKKREKINEIWDAKKLPWQLFVSASESWLVDRNGDKFVETKSYVEAYPVFRIAGGPISLDEPNPDLSANFHFHVKVDTLVKNFQVDD